MNYRKENFGLVILVAILFAAIGNAEGFFSNIFSRGRRSVRQTKGEKSGNSPLILTRLIEAGRIDDAREKAKVQHPQMSNVSSYSGYLTVNKKDNSNLFFWYFPAEVNSADAPVVLYLEGGPGVTGFFGLFIHNGPFIVNSDLTLERREYSWSKSYNLIYIDSPVGTGYSFTDNDNALPEGQIQIGDELRIALVQFFRLFPSLRKNDFFVTGESYAGKFVPAVCYSIHINNPIVAEQDRINLKGMAIANGYTDPLHQLVYGEYLYKIGLVDANGRDQFLALEKQAYDLIRAHKHSEAYEVAVKFIEGDPAGPPTLFKNLTGYDWSFNILKTQDPIRVDNFFAWLQRSDVRRALHVGDRPFNGFAPKVSARLRNDATHSQANLVAELADHYRVLIYTGQLDIVVAYSTVQNYLEHLVWSGAEEFKTAERRKWIVDGELAGYAKTVGNLTDVLVRLAGHIVAMDQPRWNLELLDKFTKGIAI